MKYPVEKLRLLQNWLSRKVDSLDTKTNNPDEYNEANLSKNILEFVQYLVKCELDKTHWYEQFTTNPYTPPTTTHIKTSSNTSAYENVCPVCKAKDPTLKYCIHRIAY